MSARPQHVLASIILLGLTSSVVWPPAAHAASGKLYRWVDEKGVVHYGDSIPPQYAKQERQVLNEQGVEVGRLEAEKTDAQRAEEEVRRQAGISARQRDQILLKTYVSVEQIQQLRDQRLDMVEGQVKVATQYLETLRNRLKQMQTQAQQFRPYSSNAGAGPLPDDLAKDLVRTINEIRVQERALAGKHAEHTQMNAQFQSDIERYRHLRGIK